MILGPTGCIMYTSNPAAKWDEINIETMTDLTDFLLILYHSRMILNNAQICLKVGSLDGATVAVGVTLYEGCGLHLADVYDVRCDWFCQLFQCSLP